jgi:hypothetical protein
VGRLAVPQRTFSKKRVARCTLKMEAIRSRKRRYPLPAHNQRQKKCSWLLRASVSVLSLCSMVSVTEQPLGRVLDVMLTLI